MQLTIKPIIIKIFLFDITKLITPDNVPTNDWMITNAIIATYGTNNQNFAFVYPPLKKSGICIPTITEKIKNETLKPINTSCTFIGLLLNNAIADERTIIANIASI